jgi:hypothetical protein
MSAETKPPVSVGELFKGQFVMRRVFVVPAATLLVLLGVAAVANWSRTGTLWGVGFSDRDVTAVESEIRAHYAKQPGMNVDDVRMIRKSPTKLAGFARIHLLGMAMNKSCTATLAPDGRSLWQCK